MANNEVSLTPSPSAVDKISVLPTPGNVSTKVAGIIFKNATVQILGQVISAAAKYAAYIVIFRSRGAEFFGEYSLVLIMLSFCEIVLDFGVNDIMIRELSRHSENKKMLLSTLFSMRILLVCVAYLSLIGILFVMRYPPEIVKASLLGGIELLFVAGILIFRTVYRAQMTFKWDVFADVTSTLFYIASISIACFYHTSLLSLFSLLVLSKAIYLGISLIAARKWVSFSAFTWSGSSVLKYFCKSIPVGISMIMVMLYINLGTLMLSKLTEMNTVGIYSAAFRFLFPLLILPSALMGAMYPVLCRYWEKDHQRFHTLFQEGFDIISVLSGCLICVIIPGASFLIGFFGDEASAAVPLLQFFAVGVAIMYISSVIGPQFVTIKKQWIAMVIGIVGVILNTVLNLILIPRYKAMGAVTSTIITELVILIAGIFIIQRLIGYVIKWKSVAYASVATFVSLLVIKYTNTDNSVVGSIISISIYTSIIAVSGIVNPAKVRFLISSIREKS